MSMRRDNLEGHDASTLLNQNHRVSVRAWRFGQDVPRDGIRPPKYRTVDDGCKTQDSGERYTPQEFIDKFVPFLELPTRE